MTNIQYAVVVFPSLDAADRIERIRQRFDPLAALLAAHVTVVFPFADSIAVADLTKHVAWAAAGTAPFDTTLAEMSSEPDGYIMLNVAAGAASFADLHARLYTGILAAHLSPSHTYRPHLTVARVAEHQQLALTAEVLRREFTRPFSGRVTELAVVRIEGDTGSVLATSRLGTGSAPTAASVAAAAQ